MQIIATIEHMHEQGTHPDLKLEEVLLARRGEPTI
jgi:hypothetical protein